MIKAPYNFVPLSDKVFFPPWAEQVSHDIPFSDGESGEIEVTITAKSPIFIRNHEVNGNKYYTTQKGKEVSTEFCNYNGEYYIPSSSVKGMIKNILEIISFSKIKIDPKHKNKMAIRDLVDMRNMPELVGSATGKTDDHTFGYGTLELNEDGNYLFIDYGNKIRLILQQELINDNINYSSNTAMLEDVGEKYNHVSPFTPIQVRINNTNTNNRFFDKHTVSLDVNGNERGELFFGGHLGNKHYEFVLLDSDRDENSNVVLPSEVLRSFKQIYFDNESESNYVGNYWKGRNRIPVFYNKSGNTITDLGLTQLFKKQYKFSLEGASNQESKTFDIKGKKENYLDLSETIFGVLREVLPSLKGRVQFSHFKCDNSNNVKKYGTFTTTLSEPKPSFYASYISQKCQANGRLVSNKYNTLMSLSKISGWKLYPLRKITQEIPPAISTDTATTFTPLGNYKENTIKSEENFNEITFRGKIRYHNLNTFERGALISALTFHNNHDKFYHNIGMGKMFGFGKIKIEVNIEKYLDDMKAFEFMMNNFLGEDWIETEQMKELFHIFYKDIDIDEHLEYLKLIVGQENPNNNLDEFKISKQEKQCLPKCSQLYSLNNDYPSSLLVDYNGEEAKTRLQKHYDLLEQTKEYYAYINIAKSNDIGKLKNFIRKFPNGKYTNTINNKISKLEKQKRYDTAKENLKKRLEEQNQNYLKTGLEKFIRENKEFDDLVRKAQKALDTLEVNKVSHINVLSLSEVKTNNDLLKFIKSKYESKELDNFISELKPIIEGFYNQLESNRKKNKFIKDIENNAYKNFFNKLGID